MNLETVSEIQDGSALRWELGSEFHLDADGRGSGPDLPKSADLYGSGRDALRSVIKHGIATYGWSILWVPSYFCQTVLKDIKCFGIEIKAYPDGPLDQVSHPIEISEGANCAILTLNPFGLREHSRPIEIKGGRMWVIEDHTHDPWSVMSKNSKADFCICSLRKTIPIPDGGMLWSPVHHKLPARPDATKIRVSASGQKLAGMVLKKLFLEGISDTKELARSFFSAGEGSIASGSISGMPAFTEGLLSQFPARKWRRVRSENFQAVATRICAMDGVEVVLPAGEAVPFCVVLRLDTNERRDYVRKALIQKYVYPATLWSLEDPMVEGIRTQDLEFSRRMLACHCDARYSIPDMFRFVDILRGALN